MHNVAEKLEGGGPTVNLYTLQHSCLVLPILYSCQDKSGEYPWYTVLSKIPEDPIQLFGIL